MGPSNPFSQKCSTLLAWLILCGGFFPLLAACGPAQPVAEENHATPSGSNDTEPSADKVPSWETWDVSFIRGSKVGYVHTIIQPITEDGRQLVQFDQHSELVLQRFNQKITQQLKLSSVETPDSELVRFSASMKAGPVPVTAKGRVEGDQLKGVITSLGKRVESDQAWSDRWGGYSAVDQSLRRQPLKPGETRTIKSLTPLPVEISASEVKLSALDWETTRLLDGEQRLLKVKLNAKMAGGEIEYFVWMDENGEALKQEIPGMGMETYRTTRDVALAKSSGVKFDLGLSTTARIAAPPRDLHRAAQAVYRIQLTGGDPAKQFAVGGSQQIKSTGERTAELTVTAVRPNQPQKPPAAEPPSDEDRSPNSLVQSDDQRVVAMAHSVAPNEKDPWRIAVALEGHVNRIMAKRGISQAFATAAEVATTREGDCTEHAVLLAALCRARKIPARVAIGLVYARSVGGFAFHMWNEVWINDRWVPLDGTLGLGGIGTGHLKLADSNLHGSSGYGTFLPVAKVMGQLEVELVDVK